MQTNVQKLPILFLIFNRNDVVVEALKSIRQYRPSRLYIAADGPRNNKPGEKERCMATRQTVIDMIDWSCEVKTLFRDENLGCAKAVSGALNWFFSSEEFGVIIEDDVILSQDFYRFAEELGERYANNDSVMMISAQYLGRYPYSKASYGFSTFAQIWGWASWRRAWAKMDMSMSRFPQIPFRRYIEAFGVIRGLIMYYYYWRHDYLLISSGGDISSWATRWAFNITADNGLVIVPGVNLVCNVGCSGTGGEHYSSDDEDLYSFLRLGNLKWPLVHPDKISLNKHFQKLENSDFLRVRWKGLKKKIRNIIRHKK